MVTMSQGERAVLEFSYKYPGQYMFHAHKTEFAEKGWVGIFNVKDPAHLEDSNSSSNGRENYTTGSTGSNNSLLGKVELASAMERGVIT
jgi:hypothetical protein